MDANRRTRFRRWQFLPLLTAALVAFSPHGQSVTAAPGDLDQNFGRFGKIVSGTGTGGMDVTDMALQSNGRIILVGRSAGRVTADSSVIRRTPSPLGPRTFVSATAFEGAEP